MSIAHFYSLDAAQITGYNMNVAHIAAARWNHASDCRNQGRATRQQFLEAARATVRDRQDLISSTTPCDIAGMPRRIATGTLFNYFPTKEAAPGLLLAAEAIAGVDRDFEESAGGVS